MKNSIIFFALTICSLDTFSQSITSIDTIQFTADSSYSRAVVRMKNELIFGTSKTGVIAFNEKSKTSKTIFEVNENGEFRDIALKGNSLFAMVSGDNGLVLESTKDQKAVLYYKDSAFFDDLVVSGNTLFVLGDPTNRQFLLKRIAIKTGEQLPICSIASLENEACYAASGTTATVFKNGDYGFVSGGKGAARFHRINFQDSSKVFSVNLPMTNGDGAGPFSVYFWDNLNGVVVGGNYQEPRNTVGTCCFTNDGGKTWVASTTGTSGYRSCVTGNNKILFACGTTGIDVSIDHGKTWKSFMKGNYCALLLEKNRLYATTNKGKCLKISFH